MSINIFSSFTFSLFSVNKVCKLFIWWRINKLKIISRCIVTQIHFLTVSLSLTVICASTWHIINVVLSNTFIFSNTFMITFLHTLIEKPKGAFQSIIISLIIWIQTRLIYFFSYQNNINVRVVQCTSSPWFLCTILITSVIHWKFFLK